ncbi:MAG: response regulator [Deltaproteobacteria bacterium]|nr:response regulator [Deltaproteobacteria bacterium]
MKFNPIDSNSKLSGSSLDKQVKVLTVDDNTQNLEVLEGLLTARGYDVLKAYNGREALEKVEEFNPDIILLDVLMPVMDGYEVCKQLKSKKETRLIPVVLLTALDSGEDKIRGIEAGADDFITKPFQKLELLARVKSLVRVKALLDELENAQDVLFSLALALDFNDPYTHGHSQRVAEFSQRLAAFLGLPIDEQDRIKSAGILHDIGKIATDKGVLHKPGTLSSNELTHVKEHPVIGVKICEPLQFAKPLIPIIRGHHEKFNGTGYPDGLAGDEIPLGARIMSIVDVYDALTSVRPYRSDIPAEVAIEVMKAEAVKGYWDKEILGAFSEMLLTEGDFGNSNESAD